MGTPDSTVAIIGAGLTGLLAAHGLKKHGFNVIVFDRDAEIDARPRDWSILVHWALPTLLELLPQEIVGELPSAFCNPHLDFSAADVETLPCYNAVTGDLLFRSPTPGARRVSRQMLRRVLARGIDIRWGKALSGLALTSGGDKVHLTFEDGEEAEVSRVLGADGSASKARELLMGAEKAAVQGSGLLFATGITKFGDVEKTSAIVDLHPVAALMMGLSSVGAVGTMAVDDPRDRSTWTTFWVRIWRGEPVRLRDDEALDYIRGKTAALSGVFQSAVDWTPEGSRVFIDEMKYWVPVPWDNLGGRATLAGDAAHPMLIYRGQGFQHSITDAQKFVDSLVRIRRGDDGDDTVSAARIMQDYDDEVVARGAPAVQQSLQEAEKSFNLDAIRNMLMATQGHGRNA